MDTKWFHTGTPPSKKKDLDGYEQTPRGGIPQTRQSELGRGRQIEQWQQLDLPFPFYGLGQQQRGRIRGT